MSTYPLKTAAGRPLLKGSERWNEYVRKQMRYRPPVAACYAPISLPKDAVMVIEA